MKRRIQKKILKKRQPLLKEVIIILDEIDPMGLLHSAEKAGFELEEEYSPEAKDIVANLSAQMTVVELEHALKRIFDKWFYYPDIHQEYYMASARRIMNAWLVFQGKDAMEFPDDIELPKHKDPIIVEVD